MSAELAAAGCASGTPAESPGPPQAESSAIHKISSVLWIMTLVPLFQITINHLGADEELLVALSFSAKQR